MPTQDYRLQDGTRVPGVTTVLNELGWKTNGLVGWAYKVGREGGSLHEARDQALTVGTIVHARIEADIQGLPTPYLDMPGDWEGQVQRGLAGYQMWREGFKVEPTDTEVALVSEQHRFGGTLDIAARVNGRRCILDLKAAKDIYHDYQVQIATYGRLWDENHPEDPITGGYHILRVGKEDGSFAHYWWPDLLEEWDVFLHVRAIWDLHQKIKVRGGR